MFKRQISWEASHVQPISCHPSSSFHKAGVRFLPNFCRHSTRSLGPEQVLGNNDNRIIPGDCFHGNGNESAAENS